MDLGALESRSAVDANIACGIERAIRNAPFAAGMRDGAELKLIAPEMFDLLAHDLALQQSRTRPAMTKWKNRSSRPRN